MFNVYLRFPGQDWQNAESFHTREEAESFVRGGTVPNHIGLSCPDFEIREESP